MTSVMPNTSTRTIRKTGSSDGRTGASAAAASPWDIQAGYPKAVGRREDGGRTFINAEIAEFAEAVRLVGLRTQADTRGQEIARTSRRASGGRFVLAISCPRAPPQSGQSNGVASASSAISALIPRAPLPQGPGMI